MEKPSRVQTGRTTVRLEALAGLTSRRRVRRKREIGVARRVVALARGADAGCEGKGQPDGVGARKLQRGEGLGSGLFLVLDE